MTPREQAQSDIVRFLTDHSSVFNAPYGVLANLDKLKSGGAVRTVTFGCARTLDAVVSIWGADKLVLRCVGPAVQVLGATTTFTSVAGLLAHLSKIL